MKKASSLFVLMSSFCLMLALAGPVRAQEESPKLTSQRIIFNDYVQVVHNLESLFIDEIRSGNLKNDQVRYEEIRNLVREMYDFFRSNRHELYSLAESLDSKDLYYAAGSCVTDMQTMYSSSIYGATSLSRTFKCNWGGLAPALSLQQKLEKLSGKIKQATNP